ncbi:MAG: hypothetical protein H0T89_34715 [Deltaproteobacteria bacterium]|nr:hypothetical protein [Deltaproteobacteria bacterium]MDQ3298016.1 hypothetical protein [Myxococcota bacterium]
MRCDLFLGCLAGSIAISAPHIAQAGTAVDPGKPFAAPVSADSVNEAGQFADSFATDRAQARRPGANLAAQLAAQPQEIVIGNAGAGMRGPEAAAPVLAPARTVIAEPRMALTFSTSVASETQTRAPVIATTLARVRPERRLRLASHRASSASEQIVAKVQTAYVDGLQRCYRKALPGTGGGNVKLMFTVDEQGVVKRPTVSAPGSAPDTGIDACVRLRMTSWRFAEAVRASRQSAMVSLTLAIQSE